MAPEPLADTPLSTNQLASTEKRGASDKRDVAAPPVWIAFLTAVVPLLWFMFALAAFYRLEPLAEAAIRGRNVDTIKVGLVELQLEHVSASKPGDAVAIAKEDIPLDREVRKRLTSRFARMTEQTRGAHVLWVDDNHPFQNVNERRVLQAANIAVDLATSTAEALNWLARAKYDIVITDLDRAGRDASSAPCFGLTPQPANAGCALLREIGDCFNPEVAARTDCARLRLVQKAKGPALLVYAGAIRPELGSPAYARMTNQPAQLFDFVLDALEPRTLPSSEACDCDGAVQTSAIAAR